MNAIWIKWVDSNGQNGWSGSRDVDSLRPAHVLEVAFLLHEDDDCVVLSPTIKGRDTDGHSPHRDIISIPKFAIYERGEVELK